MPLEDIEVKKAPKGWTPTSDQRRRIEEDPRLQRLSTDELYFFFNQKPRDGTRVQRGTAPAPGKKKPESSGVFGWVDSVREALGGN